jgi:hypothetical protein
VEPARGRGVGKEVAGLAAVAIDRYFAICSLRERQDPHLLRLLIDCEEDRTLRAVLVGMLRETGR